MEPVTLGLTNFIYLDYLDAWIFYNAKMVKNL